MLLLWMNLFHPGLCSFLWAALYRLWPLGRGRLQKLIVFLIPGATFGIFQIIQVFVGLLFQGFRMIERQNLLLLLLFSLVILESLIDVSFVSFLNFDGHSRPILGILLLLHLFALIFLRSWCAQDSIIFQHHFVILVYAFHKVLDRHGYFLLRLVNRLLNNLLRFIWRWLDCFWCGAQIFRRLISNCRLFLLLDDLWFLYYLGTVWRRAEKLLSANVLGVSRYGLGNAVSLSFPLRHIFCFGDGFFPFVHFHENGIFLLLLFDNFRHRNRCQGPFDHNRFWAVFDREELPKLGLFLIC